MKYTADNQCGQAVSSLIEFPPYIYTQVLDTTICSNSAVTLYTQQNAAAENCIWSTGETGPELL